MFATVAPPAEGTNQPVGCTMLQVGEKVQLTSTKEVGKYLQLFPRLKTLYVGYVHINTHKMLLLKTILTLVWDEKDHEI